MQTVLILAVVAAASWLILKELNSRCDGLTAYVHDVKFLLMETRREVAETTKEEIRQLITNQKKLAALVTKLKDRLGDSLANDQELAAEVDEALAMELPTDPDDETQPVATDGEVTQ